MPTAPPTVFHATSLEANRRGELSADQQRGFRALARSNRRSALSMAAYFLFGAGLVGFFASSTAPVITRAIIVSIALAVGVSLIVWAVMGVDALTRDLRRGQVLSVEGAIGKRRQSAGRLANYTLQVGDRRFKVARDTYIAAPDAGLVRLYFLPRSRKIVNLERLPNAPIADEITPKSLASSLGASFGSPTFRERNEARAELAAVSDLFEAALTQSAAAVPGGSHDATPLGEAIVGSWSNVFMSVKFSADGDVTIRTIGGQTRSGRWSVDGAGRLRAELTGQHGIVDASIVGNQLTVALEGQGMRFTRDTRS